MKDTGKENTSRSRQGETRPFWKADARHPKGKKRKAKADTPYGNTLWQTMIGSGEGGKTDAPCKTGKHVEENENE